MDFELVFKFLIDTFERENIDFALMGGFALQASGLTRTTRDIDLVILSENSSKIKDILLKTGYELIHESEEVLNFAGKRIELGRIDFLLAHRKYAISMLRNASKKSILDGKYKVKVLRVEDLIGLKIQASSNDPSRLNQDMADIELLIRCNRASINKNIIREYFALFKRENEFDKLLKEIEKC